MSLRDQLLAKGLVSKKRAKQVDRDARSERKKSMGNRKKKRVLEAEQAESKAQARATKKAKREQDRVAHRDVRDRHEAVLRVRQILQGNALRNRGPVRFHHRALRGDGLPYVQLSEAMAEQVRRGSVGICALDHGTRVAYLLLPKVAIEKLQELAPQLLMAWFPDTEALSDPSLKLSTRDWDPDLRAHRRPVN